MQVGVTGSKRGTMEGVGGKGIISKSQAGKNRPAWPPVSEEGEKVNTPPIRFHFFDLYCASLQN